RLITGHGRFSDDFNLDGQVFAAIVRSPHPHARIAAIDLGAARAMPGVLGVYCGEDCRVDGLQPIQHSPIPATKYDMKLTGPSGSAIFAGRHMLLTSDKVRHVGEAVAMVVARTANQAQDATEVVRVEYETLPVVVDAQAALAPGAPTIWQEAPGNVLVDTVFGDVDATNRAFAAADHVVRMDFDIGRVTAAPMEPR